MAYQSDAAKAAGIIPSRFLLTKILADRVKQLQSGIKPRVEVDENATFVEIALKEIAEGKVELLGLDKAEVY